MNIEYIKEISDGNAEECYDDDIATPKSDTSDSGHKTYENETDFRKITFKYGMTVNKRKNPQVIRYVRFNTENDLENFHRERLLLFFPWKNDLFDFKMDF